MPLFLPSGILRHAVALTTACRNLDEPGGGQKLIDLVRGTDCATNQLALLALARLLGEYLTDEGLQEFGLRLVDEDRPCEL